MSDEIVCPKVIESIRKRFHERADDIVACSLPWTPWALTHLLNIDDSSSAIPAELILYQALLGKGRSGVAQCHPTVQVCLSCCTHIRAFNLLIVDR